MKKLLIMLTIFVALGCNKDELKDKTYHELHDFYVEFPTDTTVSILQFDSLKLAPIIKNQDFSNTTYSYEWKFFGGGADYPPTIISTDKNLAVRFDYEPSGYFLQFNVIDDKTGIKQIKLYNITVEPRFGEGWLVASNRQNKGELAFVNMKGQVFQHIIEDFNDKSYEDRAVSVSAVQYYNPFGGSMSRVYYFTDKGLYQFDAGSYEEIGSLNSLFFQPLTFTNIPHYGQDAIARTQFLINNGKLYGAATENVGEEEIGTFSAPFTEDTDLFPFIFGTNNSARTMFYDNIKKQFWNVASGARSLGIATNLKENGVIGKTMIGADFASLTVGNYFALMKNDRTGTYDLHQFDMTNIATITAVTYTYKPDDVAIFTSLPEINQATAYAASSNFKHFYYSTQNKIFRIDFLAKTVSQLYEFPAGLTIADMKMYKRINRNYQSNATNASHNKIIVVSVNNGDNGELHYIPLNDLGVLDNNKDIEKVIGFGNIRNIDYRSPR